MNSTPFLFPRWSNDAPKFVAAGITVVTVGLGVAIWYFATNKFFEVGYQPKQPVEYSHKLHAGELGMDCRYCHSTVERSSHASVPATQVCMNCHSRVRADSAKLLPIRESWASDQPVPWIKVHNLPDYVYFNHAAHLAVGVGCSTCHGRVDQMARVRQEKPLSMGWCLDCHRNPAPHLRPAGHLTDMAWEPRSNLDDAAPAPAVAANGREVHPPTHCSGCHR